MQTASWELSFLETKISSWPCPFSHLYELLLKQGRKSFLFLKVLTGKVNEIYYSCRWSRCLLQKSSFDNQSLRVMHVRCLPMSGSLIEFCRHKQVFISKDLDKTLKTYSNWFFKERLAVKKCIWRKINTF